MKRFAISDQPIAVEPLKATLRFAEAGGFCSFEGWVRNVHQGLAVRGLDYQAHPLLAESTGQMIVQQIIESFAIIDACCVHRIGSLRVGEIAVWVGVAAGHRDAAFAACRAIIDRVKLEVPIWKHEHYLTQEPRWRHE